MKTWVLVACRSGAQIFERPTPTSPLRLVSYVDHPEGRLRNRDLGSDSPGRAFDRGSEAHGRHALEPEEAPIEHAANEFARLLADEVTRARQRSLFDRLVLVVEPRFLGRVRDALDEPTRKLVDQEVARDLVHVPRKELEAQLASL